jgi:two-component system response regulator YesN
MSMYNVLIADDDPNVCEGLSIMIDWEKYGFRVVDTAANGKETLNKLQNGRYNLVITDIRMPVLTGLELIKAIFERGLNVKVIIISGYNDFEYAKEAMGYGVKGYLLKPVSRIELEQYLLGIKKELDSELKKRLVSNDNEKFIRDKFLFDFINGNLTEKEIYNFTEKLNMNVIFKTYNIALIEIDDFFRVVEENVGEAKLTMFAVRNIVEETINERYNSFVYDDLQGKIGILLCGDELISQKESLESCLENIIGNVSKYLHKNLSIGIGEITSNYSNIKKCRKQAQFALNKRIVIGTNKIINYSYVNTQESFLNLDLDQEKLINFIEQSKTEEIDIKIDKIMEELVSKNVSLAIINTLIYNIIFAISKIINKRNGDIWKAFDASSLDKIDIENMTIVQLKDWLKKNCKNAAIYIGEIQYIKQNNIISQVLNYISRNYHEDLSLKKISKEFYLNSAYLGQLFKIVTGESFNDYLNKFRISIAKKMIYEEQEEKIYAMIEKVGYKNPEHFYRQFKRYENISFPEYKNSITNKNQ